MYLDTHCHLSEYFRPIEAAEDSQRNNVRVISVTNLPSLFARDYERFKSFKNIRVAIGVHPLYAHMMNESEWTHLRKALEATRYVGEVGLDFSRHRTNEKNEQEVVFARVLEIVARSANVLTIHSRSAERRVLEMLEAAGALPTILHWFSGPLRIAEAFAERGDYFSFNVAMLRSKKGKELLGTVPRSQVLIESDGPFAPIAGRQSWPSDAVETYKRLASEWGTDAQSTLETIERNFQALLRSRNCSP